MGGVAWYGALHTAGRVPANPAKGVVVARAAVDTGPGNRRVGVWRWSFVFAVLGDVVSGEVGGQVGDDVIMWALPSPLRTRRLSAREAGAGVLEAEEAGATRIRGPSGIRGSRGAKVHGCI